MNISAPRRATPADAPAMLAIFNHYIIHDTANLMLEPQALEEFQRRFVRAEEYPLMVIEADHSLGGWGALSEHNARAGYQHTADTTLYVHPDFHRRGIGRALLANLIEQARARGRHTLIAQCTHEAEASIALHEAFGFERIARYREVGRKFDRWLDVVTLQLML